MPSGRDERGRPCDRGGAGRGRGASRSADGSLRLRKSSSARFVAAVLGALVLALTTAATARADEDSEADVADESAAAPTASAEPVPGDPEADAPPSETGPAHALHPPPPAPLGTRFPEPLEGKQIRVRYQYKRAKYQGMLIADRDARPGFVRNDQFIPYVETPRALDVTTHLVEVAYAPHPRTTLVLQVPFIEKDLETLEASGTRRRDQTDGVGDISLALVVPFIRKGRESSHVYIAFDVPTGDIRKQDHDGNRLPYDSQIGNGSVDFEWGWTYRGERDWLSWGGQATGRHAIDENGLNYREGSRFEASLWSGVRIVGGLSASVRVQWQKQNNLSGRDRAFDKVILANPKPPPPDLNLPNDPSENGKARGGTRFLVGPGLAYDFSGPLAGQRLAVEVSVPVHQDLDGPQLEQDWSLTTGWQWVF